MKSPRHEKIIELITAEEISTQEELTALLAQHGFKTTQATVSRDIKALKLRKIPTKSGQKYALPGTGIVNEKEKYLRIFSDGMITMDQAANLVVIRTNPGMAMAAAAALDELKMNEIVGSIAGDDTIMCACRSNDEAGSVIERLKELLSSGTW